VLQEAIVDVAAKVPHPTEKRTSHPFFGPPK
jgi:hypothetical protein